MSLAVLRSRALAGMEAPAVNVEVHLANGLPGIAKAGMKTPIYKWVLPLPYSSLETRLSWSKLR